MRFEGTTALKRYSLWPGNGKEVTCVGQSTPNSAGYLQRPPSVILGSPQRKTIDASSRKILGSWPVDWRPSWSQNWFHDNDKPFFSTNKNSELRTREQERTWPKHCVHTHKFRHNVRHVRWRPRRPRSLPGSSFIFHLQFQWRKLFCTELLRISKKTCQSVPSPRFLKMQCTSFPICFCFCFCFCFCSAKDTCYCMSAILPRPDTVHVASYPSSMREINGSLMWDSSFYSPKIKIKNKK